MFYEASRSVIAVTVMTTIASIVGPISHVSTTPPFDGRTLSHSIFTIQAG
jgi:hypothetical protein